jgi:two-component system, NtrC family, sensor histidine kinase PilS
VSRTAKPRTEKPRTAGPYRAEELRRRITYLMLFRVVLITLVLGATTLLSWMSQGSITSGHSVAINGIIATTYLLTIVYALALRRGLESPRLADLQLAIDLVIASVLIHATGGAESAYTFFFPLAIIGAATVRYRRGAIAVAAAGGLLFLAVSVLGWWEVIPALRGQPFRPGDLTSIELARAVALNLAAIVGVGFLAVNLGGQLERTSATLESQRSAAADLLTLHGDIVRSLTSGLITVGCDDVVLTANRAACEILGVTAVDAVGAPLADVLPGLEAPLSTIAPNGALQRAELHVERGGRELMLGASVSPLTNHRHETLGRVVHFQDLTELKQMEEHMKQAERLAVIGSLAAGVAHEIRNPLASISGSIELLRKAPQADDDSRSLMEIVTREIDRLNGLISELLDYTNPRPLKPAQFDLAELVRDTLRVFGQDRGFSSVEVSLQEEDGSVELSADPEKIRQVLWNLLRNAAEAASQGGGHVTVRLRGREEGVELEIADDGPGIPKENLGRVFDPFFTSKSSGSGLGLATVHNVVAGHGGRIRVESEPGQGAKFVTYLPYTAPHGD